MFLLQAIMNSLNTSNREILEQEMMEYLRTKGWGPIPETVQQQKYVMPEVNAFEYSICRVGDNPSTWTDEYDKFSNLKEDYNWSSKWNDDAVFCVIKDKIIIAKAIVNKRKQSISNFIGEPMWENFIRLNLFN